MVINWNWAITFKFTGDEWLFWLGKICVLDDFDVTSCEFFMGFWVVVGSYMDLGLDVRKLTNGENVFYRSSLPLTPKIFVLTSPEKLLKTFKLNFVIFKSFQRLNEFQNAVYFKTTFNPSWKPRFQWPFPKKQRRKMIFLRFFLPNCKIIEKLPNFFTKKRWPKRYNKKINLNKYKFHR